MWYTVKIKFTSKIDGIEPQEPLMEESFFLIRSDDEVDARESAKRIALEKEQSYENEQGELVSWHFSEILDVYDLCEAEIFSGIEVYSNHYRAS